MAKATEFPREEFAEGVRQFLEECSGGAAQGAWSQMAELGWLGLSIDEKYGGLGFGVNELAVLYTELGRCLFPGMPTATFLGAQALEFAHEYLRATLLPEVASGAAKFAFILPVKGFAPLTRQADGGWRGEFSLVPCDDDCTHIFMPAIGAGEEPSIIVAPVSSCGLKTAMAVDESRVLKHVSISNFIPPPENIIQPYQGGWRALADHACIAIAADSIGGAARIFDITTEYLCVREQFGRPIGSFQSLKHRAANWKALLEAASALTFEAAASTAIGNETASLLAVSAKFYAADAYAGIAGDAVQLHGGIGFTWEHACHRYLKRAKFNQAVYGAATELKDRAAEMFWLSTEERS